jgi:hypothetical protein
MPTTHLLLSKRLEREWAALRRRRDAVAAARRWGVTSQPFADLDGLLRLAGYQVAGSPECNEVLLRLVAVAKRDELAARVVLQRIMPGLLALVRRRARRQEDGAFEELIGAVWMSIRCCPDERRHPHVAANLVRDAAYRAFTAPTRRRSATEVSVDPRVLDETPATTVVSAFEELAGVVAEGRSAGMASSDLQLVRDLVRVGSPKVLAGERKVTPRTIRNHRDRVTRQLRRATLAA